MGELLSLLGYEREINPEWQTWADAYAKASGDEKKDLWRQGREIQRYFIKKRAMTPEEQQQADFEAQMREKYQGVLGSGGRLPPEVQAQLDEMYGNQMRLGQQAIDKAATRAAGARGLGLGDTPIGDPYLRATADLGSNLGAARAGHTLGLRTEEMNRAGSYLSYLDQLKQLRGFQNPYAVADAYKSFALGLYGPRFSKGTTTQTGPAPSQGFNLGQVLGGIGGLASGIGGLFGGGAPPVPSGNYFKLY